MTKFGEAGADDGEQQRRADEGQQVAHGHRNTSPPCSRRWSRSVVQAGEHLAGADFQEIGLIRVITAAIEGDAEVGDHALTQLGDEEKQPAVAVANMAATPAASRKIVESRRRRTCEPMPPGPRSRAAPVRPKLEAVENSRKNVASEASPQCARRNSSRPRRGPQVAAPLAPGRRWRRAQPPRQRAERGLRPPRRLQHSCLTLAHPSRCLVYRRAFQEGPLTGERPSASSRFEHPMTRPSRLSTSSPW